MNRRTFFRRLTAGATAAIAALIATRPRGFIHFGRGLPLLLHGSEPVVQKFGYMDVARWKSEGCWPMKIFLDGVDVTPAHCLAFDDLHGYIVFLYRDAGSGARVDPTTGQLRVVKRTGRVEARADCSA